MRLFSEFIRNGSVSKGIIEMSLLEEKTCLPFDKSLVRGKTSDPASFSRDMAQLARLGGEAPPRQETIDFLFYFAR